MTSEEFLLQTFSEIGRKRLSIEVDFVFFSSNSFLLLAQDLKNKTLEVSYLQIWEVLEKKYGMQYTEIQEFIKDMVEKHLGIKGFIPVITISSFKSIK